MNCQCREKHYPANHEAKIYRSNQKGLGWWIGWVEEIPGVNSQGKTKAELVKNLRSALSEALEFNRADAAKPPRMTTRKLPFWCETPRTDPAPDRPGLPPYARGACHSWWENSDLNRRSAVPRHTEINPHLARKIRRDLGVEEV